MLLRFKFGAKIYKILDNRNKNITLLAIINYKRKERISL